MLYHLKELVVVYFLKSLLSNLSFYLEYRNNLIYESIFRFTTKRFDKPSELGKDMADEIQPRKMLCHPCYQEENSL
jgi:hypothetical protein